MNILFIHEVDWLNKVVFEIHNLAEALSLLNHKVYAIDYQNSWKKNSLFDLGSLKTKEFNVSRAIPKSSVYLRRPGFIKLPGLSRLSAGYTHYREIRRTIKEKNIDVVVLYSVPTNGIQTIRLAKRFGVPVVFRSIDILHRLVPFLVLRPMTKFIERKVYAEVDKILAITPNHRRYVINMGAQEEKVQLLLMPIDIRVFHPAVDSNEVRWKWNLGDNDQIIVFIGTLFDFSGLDSFIPQFPKILEQVPEAKLLIVGDGPQRPKLEKAVAELKLGNKVTITGFQPYETMPQYINLAAVCINPFLNTPATEDIFPGKIIQYLGCGKPTVATPLLGITALVEGETQGVIYANRAEDIAQEVAKLLKSAERQRRLGQSGLDYVRQFHDQTRIARQAEMELQEVVEIRRLTIRKAKR